MKSAIAAARCRRYPVGTTRIRTKHRGYRVRLIKVREHGPIAGRWIEYARWWWERKHGKAPPGYRVAHLDGDTLHDDPANYGLLTAGEVLQLYHRLRPEMSARNRRNCSAGTAQHNRLRGQIRRATRWLRTSWYLVQLSDRTIVDGPQRSRRRLLERRGVQVSINGHGRAALEAIEAAGLIAVRGRDLEKVPGGRGGY